MFALSFSAYRMRAVLFVTIALLLAVAYGQRRLCQPGTAFKVACNTCRCSRDGTEMACTRVQCYEPEPERAERICEPGSFFRRDCNNCRCNDDGTDAACTLRACV